MPEASTGTKEPWYDNTRKRTGCCLGALIIGGSVFVGGSYALVNMLNSPSASSTEYDDSARYASQSPTPEITETPTEEEVAPEATEPSAEETTPTPEETDTPTEEPTEEAPADDTTGGSKDSDGSTQDKGDKYKTCPWTPENPQKTDSNGKVEVWSSCGSPGLLAYSFPANSPIKIADGTKVTPVCRWNDGGEYVGVNSDNGNTLILSPDLGFLTLAKTCQKPR